MGTDITAFIEEIDGSYKTGDQYRTVAEIFMDSCYSLFAIISDVRNYDEPPLEFVSEAKGLPEGLGACTCEENGCQDGHSHSWLDIAEMEKAIAIAEKLPEKWCVNELRKIVTIMKLYKEARFVFWYDC